MAVSNVEENSVRVVDLLQPELLSVGTLCEILKERCVTQDLIPLARQKLVELFYRVAVPLPQRKYRENRRGLIMDKLQKRQDKKRRKEMGESSLSDEPEYKVMKSSSSMGDHLKPSSTERLKPPDHSYLGDNLKPSSAERLKPPPDQINYERKIIKLNSKSKVDSHGRKDDISKIIIKDRLNKRFDRKKDDPLGKIDIIDLTKEKNVEEGQKSKITEEIEEKHRKSSVSEEESHDRQKSSLQSVDSEKSVKTNDQKVLKIKESDNLNGKRESKDADTSTSGSTKKIKLKRSSFSSLDKEKQNSSTSDSTVSHHDRQNKKKITWP